jgi:hypothetical protein
MALTKIDEYEVMYSANTFAPSIGLKSSNNLIATLYFRPNGSALPPDDMVNNQVLLYYHLDDYQNIVDLLETIVPCICFTMAPAADLRMESRQRQRR